MRDALLLASVKLSPNDVGLPNSTGNISQGFTNAIGMLFGVIGALAVIFIIIGGLQIATAAGNPARLKQGREAVIYSVVGLVVALLAYAIVTFIGRSL